METVWASAMDASHGFTRPRPVVLFVVALALSMLGLAYAMRSIPIGTSYAIWVGIGAVGTALSPTTPPMMATRHSRRVTDAESPWNTMP